MQNQWRIKMLTQHFSSARDAFAPSPASSHLNRPVPPALRLHRHSTSSPGLFPPFQFRFPLVPSTCDWASHQAYQTMSSSLLKCTALLSLFVGRSLSLFSVLIWILAALFTLIVFTFHIPFPLAGGHFIRGVESIISSELTWPIYDKHLHRLCLITDNGSTWSVRVSSRLSIHSLSLLI